MTYRGAFRNAGLIRRRTLAGAVLLSLSMPTFPALAEMLIVQGSTTFNRRIMESHQPKIEAAAGYELKVIPNRSTPGLIALLEGQAHIAMISAPLESEIELLQKTRPDLPSQRLQAFEVSTIRVAFAVHRSNPVRSTKIDAIQRILTGEISNWQTLGGRNLLIRPVLVGGGGGVTVAVESELLKGKAIGSRHAIYVRSPVHLVQVVEQEPGAIGFAQLVLVQQRSIPELVTDQPVQQALSFVTLGEPTLAMRAVIEATRRVAESTL